MLKTVYYQIWRPDFNQDYCTDPRFSNSLAELSDGYSACENRLRSILSNSPIRDKSTFTQANLSLNHILNTIYPHTHDALRKAVFELQENYHQVMKINGQKTVRRVLSSDYVKLEKPMALSRYQCMIKLLDEEFTLQPFANLAQPIGGLGEWYLEDINAFFYREKHRLVSTLKNLIIATSAVRCLLYAQFGPVSEKAISPNKYKGSGAGYFTYDSLFKLSPPEWPEDECYQIGDAGRSFDMYPF